MLKYGNLGSKFYKTNVTFEINTFKIRYTLGFLDIKKLIPFGPISRKLGIWAKKFEKRIVRFEISTFEIGHM